VGADGATTEAGRYDEQDLEGWRGRRSLAPDMEGTANLLVGGDRHSAPCHEADGVDRRACSGLSDSDRSLAPDAFDGCAPASRSVIALEGFAVDGAPLEGIDRRSLAPSGIDRSLDRSLADHRRSGIDRSLDQSLADGSATIVVGSKDYTHRSYDTRGNYD
jgi:hypothetical protein